MNRIVIVADLGRIRAYGLRTDPDEVESRCHALELEVPTLAEVPGKVREGVSDQAGEFARGSTPGTAGGMSYGEEHQRETEHEKRLIRNLAGQINEIIVREKPEAWDLAAPQPICKRLEAELESQVAMVLDRVVGADLTKAGIKEVEERFSPLDQS